MSAKEKLTALADAIRDKTGLSSPLSLDAMTEAILNINESSLPYGWETGTFIPTEETKTGDFYITNTLSSVPSVFIILRDDPSHISNSVRGVFRVNSNIVFDEEISDYYPKNSSGRLFYDNENGTNIISIADNGSGGDTSKEILIPMGTTYTAYTPGVVYRWFAIK